MTKHCRFCDKDKDCVFVESPPKNWRMIYICEECIEVCVLIILEKRYTFQKEEVEGKQHTKIFNAINVTAGIMEVKP